MTETAITAAAAPAPAAALPSAPKATPNSLWAIGVEAKSLAALIGHLAERLDSEDEDERREAVAALEGALDADSANQTALSAKADATCWVIGNLRAQASYRQQQAKRLTELARIDASRAEALEELLVLVLTRVQPDATKFSFRDHELVSRRSQAVEISDEQALSPEWLAITTTSKPNKTAIKEALKTGLSIPGAQLVSRRSWSIK